MAEDDLDLFLLLAEQAEQPAPKHAGGTEPSIPDQRQDADEDDLDLFLQLAEDLDGVGPEGAGAGMQQKGRPGPAPSTAQPQQKQQQLAQPARAPRQERLSGWVAPKQALDPGVIPTSRPDMPLPPTQPAAPPRQQQAFRITAFQQPQPGQGQGAGGGRPGVFKDTEQGSIIERLSGLKVPTALGSFISGLLSWLLVGTKAHVKVSAGRAVGIGALRAVLGAQQQGYRAASYSFPSTDGGTCMCARLRAASFRKG
jgi:hypothetical protein